LGKVAHSLQSKDSAGLDDISPYLLKEYVPYKMKPLLELVSVSVREDIITTMLKKAVVKPIYKKGGKGSCKEL
jgi:hypothetical protein